MAGGDEEKKREKRGQEQQQGQESQEGYHVERKGGEDILYINYKGAPYVPSLAEYPQVMEYAIDILIENPNVSRVVFSQQKDYNYDSEETDSLLEIAHLYVYLYRQEGVLSKEKLAKSNERFFPERYNQVFTFLTTLKRDPLRAYADLKKFIVEGRILLDKLAPGEKSDQSNYLSLLEKVLSLLENTKILQKAQPFLDSYQKGDREIYHKLFKPDVIPNFTFTRLVSDLPGKAEIVDQYEIFVDEYDKSLVTILRKRDEPKFIYHLSPPENNLSEEHSELLNLARRVLIEHQPKAEEFTDTERTRQVFFNISKDLVQDLAKSKGIRVDYKDLNKLATILVRHTIGFGLIEVLLQDKKLQDISLNAPISKTPIFVRHQEFDECLTNVIPSQEDVDSWAAKFRLISGRPLDEANPILDTQLEIGKLRARIAIIQQPLSPDGLAYAIRRHREDPWTLPLFVQNKMINSFTAGLMSFLIDGSRTLLVAGTRSSGKTSLLGSLMLEIIPKYRVIVIEDSLELPVESLRKLKYDILRMKVRSALLKTGTEVSADEGIRTSLRLGDSSLIIGEVRSSIRGNEDVVIIENGKLKRIKIKEIEGKDIKNIYVPTIGFNLKTKLSKLTGFVKHPKRKKLLRIKTKTGREVTVTHDHSLFAPTKDFSISPIECKDLKIGSQIVIPGQMPSGFNDIDFINVFDYLPEFRVQNYEEDVRNAIKILGWKKATKVCNINSGDIYNYFRKNQKTNIPFESFNGLMSVAKVDYNIGNLKVKKGTSLTIPALIPVNEEFCRFLGYYVSEGYYSLNKEGGGSVVLTNSNPKIIQDITNISESLFNLSPNKREVKGYGNSVQHKLSCLPLTKLISRLECGRLHYDKRVPSFIFGLSKRKIASFLRALYSGDGSFTSSESSGNCVRYYSTSKKLAEDVSYLLLNFGIVGRIMRRETSNKREKGLWIIEFKDRTMVETFFKEIGFVRDVPEMIVKKWAHTKSNSVRFDKKKLKEHLIKYPRRYRHLFRFLKCSKNYLKKVVSDPNCKVSEKLKNFAFGDFFIDEIKEIKEINLDEDEFVYDLSVEPTQNFIGGFGGVLLHNTEAQALYEAMRVGALANVVAGTIHGASPYGVFDRVVNDLNVPATSFKATDIIMVANPIKSPDGLHQWKRLVRLSEVRKHWKEDPLEEKGFSDLLRYDVEKDELVPSEDLINGDSEVLKDIASSVKGWAGNWDAVYDNILLRGKIKQETVDMAKKIKNKKILEADFTVDSNHAFHRISDEIREEVGLPVSERVFPEWQKWLNSEIKKRKL